MRVHTKKTISRTTFSSTFSRNSERRKRRKERSLLSHGSRRPQQAAQDRDHSSPPSYDSTTRPSSPVGARPPALKTRERSVSTSTVTTSTKPRTRSKSTSNPSTEIVLLLSTLRQETNRANAAEAQLNELLERYKAMRQQKLNAEAQLATIREELRLYKEQLDKAQQEIFRAQQIVESVDRQRVLAEQEAQRNREKARKLLEERLVAQALEARPKRRLRRRHAARTEREREKEKPHMNLDVCVLPKKCDDPVFVKSLNGKPGLLALAMEEVEDGKGGKTLKGIPFIVPGARFNELYNWDSYFISLGLLVDGKVDMAKGMVDHFIFEITHYNKILNGSRSYYLCRSQPPFLTDMALQIYNQLDRANAEENKAWLKRAIKAAIKEYHTVWVAEPRMDPKTGLSRFRPDGLGIPPETEATHFTHILEPYAEKHGLSVLEFSEKYNDGTLKEPELDEYFLHDRAVRESGHDTTYRFEKRCANLATIDLQALLYKYEVDIGTAIREVFDDALELTEDFPCNPSLPPQKPTRTRTASARRESQILYESVTALWALWAGVASEEQAYKLVTRSIKKFEVLGGLVSGTEESRGKISLDRPNRQWDYPYAWPPHQIMAWVGLERYGYLDDAQRLAYRFLYMMTTAFVDFNGVVPEKFDAVKLSHLVDAEYGNQGIDFKMVPREGFGWMNAAYQVGLSFLTTHMRRAVATCTSPEVFFSANMSGLKDSVVEGAATQDPLSLAMEALNL
ncbi:hypothetical protein NMY22_g14692 [Coprinellus aureogranulatus]|nr:hypothetical protein NMY22_g14692 [Coprinellus aureogranulatus]